MLKQITKEQALKKERHNPLDQRTLSVAASIIEAVRKEGFDALVRYAIEFEDISDANQVIVPKAELEKSLSKLDPKTRAVLEAAAGRIESFAEAQKKCLSELEVSVPGGRAGHKLFALERAACYAPGGRYPLPSSVLMTAVTAKVAGVKQIIVASPKADEVTKAAAAIAGADLLLSVGGAQVIAALAYGVDEIPACDIIVGPGNKWVTAAKQLVSKNVAIDMLAGPSELVVVADDSVDPSVVAADLLAQAEHDPDALPILISLDANLCELINEELAKQLEQLATAKVANRAIENGFCVYAQNEEDAIEICDYLSPEHLQVVLKNSSEFAKKLSNYGALFVGEKTAEVFGDYGAGPNHVLPTSGTAKFVSGLSVFNFLKTSTWLELDNPEELVQDTEQLANIEGLAGHAVAAKKRVLVS